MSTIRLGTYPAEAVAVITFGERRLEISATNLRHLARLAEMDLRQASETVRYNMQPVVAAIGKLSDEMLSGPHDPMTVAESAECLKRYHETGSGADVTGMREFLEGRT